MRRLLFLSLALVLAACSDKPTPMPDAGHVDRLTVIDRKIGDGVEARPGMDVLVQYTGWLYDEKAADRHGLKFDSSLDHGTPFSFTLGAGQVIAGWDQGVAGMRVGGQRELLIPAALGYGAHGAGGVIPPDASLVFEVELVDANAP